MPTEGGSLLGLTPEDLSARAGCSLTEARRVIGRVIADGADDLQTRVPISRVLRERLSASFDWKRPTIVERAVSETDGFVKYLFEHEDGALAEAVRIPLDKPGRYSVCLSSQVGCAMQCVFCATGDLGLSRNLTAAEIVGAFLQVRDDTEQKDDEARVSGAVFMGQGEPFHNYDEVIQAARVLSDPCGGRISQKAITISTVGLVPKIRRYTREGHKYRLIVSLTSAQNPVRQRLLPIAGERWDLDELKSALVEHAEVTGERVTLAWVLLGGVNDTEAEAAALARRFGDLPLRLNLIDVNSPRFRRSTDAERDTFRDALRALNAPVVRRYSGGSDKQAACGMLSSTRVEAQRR